MLLEYLEKLAGTTALEQAWDLHCTTMRGFGFDRLIYGFTRFRTEKSFGPRDDVLILSNHTSEYFQRFFDEELYFDAPMLRWANENVGACSWNWVAEHMHEFNDRALEVVALNQKMGVRAGYTISFQESTVRAKGVIALCADVDMSQSDVDAMWAEHGRTVLAMNNMAHLKFISLPHPGARRSLTKRQREALEWVGEGKTTQDIAVILGLTPATVEKHLRLAREALDVDTTAQAVLKASFQNQIFIR